MRVSARRALCEAAGHKGPLAQCSIYGNKQAGAKFWKMLGHGAPDVRTFIVQQCQYTLEAIRVAEISGDPHGAFAYQ